MRKALCARSRQQQTRKDEDHMKKFLSLLLALTLVLSLVVVPARAVDGFSLNATKPSIEIGESSIITAAVTSDGVTFASGYPTWEISDPAKATLSGATAGSERVTVTGVVAGQVTVTCKYKLSTEGATEQRDTKQITITEPDCTKGVATVSFNGVSSPVTSDNKATITLWLVKPILLRTALLLPIRLALIETQQMMLSTPIILRWLFL